MAKKPFEIQSADLIIGGVNLQAGTTGVVIPGVTQATNYFVEEVDDVDGANPDTFGSDAEAVQLLDNAAFLFRSGTETPSGSYSEAGYSVQELDDGEIEEIYVEVEGTFLSADKAFAEAGNMWATTVPNAKTNFNAGDWTQIAFRPRIRAGEVENIGGGGSGDAIVDGDNSLTVDGSGNAIFQGDGSGNGVNRGLEWDYGDANGGVNSKVRQDFDGLTVRAYTEDGGGGPTGEGGGEDGGYSAPVNIVTNQDADEKVWQFDGAGNLTFPDGTVQTTAYTGVTTLDPYKGFKVMYGRMYNSEPTISKLVIYQDTATSVSSTIDEDTSSDLFRVTGLANSGIIAMINVYGSDTVSPISLATLKTFAEAVIDNVILDQGVEGDFNTVDNMRQAFYNNYSNFGDLAGSKYVDFKFSKQLWTGLQGTTQEGSGAIFEITDDGTGGYQASGILDNGTNYQAGHKIKVLGTDLGGATPANDCIITVDSISEGGLIFQWSVSGTAAGTEITLYSPVTGTNYQVGSGAVFALFRNDTDGIPQWDGQSQPGSNYVVGDVILVQGTDVDGLAPDNNITITITGVDPGGLINGSVSLSGTLPTNANPDYSIYDGGNDQYDTANYIFTDLQGDSRASTDPGVEDADWALPYNVDTVSDGELFFGSGSEYTVVYNNSIFGLFVRGADISWIGTNGNSGFDGDGQADTGSLYESNSNIGDLTFATETITGWDANTLTGPTLRLGTDATQQTIITGPAPTDSYRDAQRLVIQGQRGYGGEDGGPTSKGEGGDVYIWAGTGGEGGFETVRGDGGDVKLRGGHGGNNGGYIRIESGDAQAASGTGGFVDITAGNANNGTGTGGAVNITAGSGSGNGGAVIIVAGQSSTDGGDVIINAGLGATNNGVVFIETSSDGNTYNNEWKFDNGGTLHLPTGGDIVDSSGESVLNLERVADKVGSQGWAVFIGDSALNVLNGSDFYTGGEEGEIALTATCALPDGSVMAGGQWSADGAERYAVAYHFDADGRMLWKWRDDTNLYARVKSIAYDPSTGNVSFAVYGNWAGRDFSSTKLVHFAWDSENLLWNQLGTDDLYGVSDDGDVLINDFIYVGGESYATYVGSIDGERTNAGTNIPAYSDATFISTGTTMYFEKSNITTVNGLYPSNYGSTWYYTLSGALNGIAGIGEFNNVPYTYGGSGTATQLNLAINYNNGNYNVVSTSGGTGWIQGESVTVLGTNFPGGVSPGNDLVLTATTDTGDSNPATLTGFTISSGTASTSIIKIQLNSGDASTPGFALDSISAPDGQDILVGSERALHSFKKVFSNESYGELYSIAHTTDASSYYVGGYSVETGSAQQYGIIAKVSDAGALTWVKHFTNVTSVYSVASDGTNVYATTDSGDLIAVDATGTVLWQTYFNAAMAYSNRPTVTYYDGFLYVSGQYNAVWTTGDEWLVEKVSPDTGLAVWQRSLKNLIGEDILDSYNGIFANTAVNSSGIYVSAYGFYGDNYWYNSILFKVPLDGGTDLSIDDPASILPNKLKFYNPAFGSETPSRATGSSQSTYDASAIATWKTANLTYSSSQGVITSAKPGFRLTNTQLSSTAGLTFADGTLPLQHNPTDVPVSAIAWNSQAFEHTLTLNDRGKFIRTRTGQSETSNHTVLVPSDAEVEFPIGSVITLINMYTVGGGGAYMYINPKTDIYGTSPRIYVPGFEYTSTWGFQGVGVATLMKVGTNEWLLTGNGIIDTD
jgi:hypothetical protein